jgi:hypothetical protein
LYKINPAEIRAAKMMAIPMTTPAIAPPVRPDFTLVAIGKDVAEVVVVELVAEDVVAEDSVLDFTEATIEDEVGDEVARFVLTAIKTACALIPPPSAPSYVTVCAISASRRSKV